MAKFIEQSFEVLTEGDLQKQIEARGRLCYKSEDKITKSSAKKFIAGIIKNGHGSVMEMGVIHLRFSFPNRTIAYAFLEELRISSQKFLFVDMVEDMVWVTGSVRALREWILNCPEHALANAARHLMAVSEPSLFGDLPDSGVDIYSGLLIDRMATSELPESLKFTHQHVAVKFDTNRAVTHEIVRHRPCSFLQESQRYCRYADDVVFIKPTAFNFDDSDVAQWENSMLASEAIYLKLIKDQKNTPQEARTVLPNSCKTEIIVYCNLREWSHVFCLRTSAAAEPSMQEAMKPVLAEFKDRFPMVFDELKIAVG